MLPDVALLEIFDFYVWNTHKVQAWHRLLHVCRKWRHVVFGSPLRLNLRLYCRANTPVRQTLDVWPLLPIVVKIYTSDSWDQGNPVAALEQNNRICHLAIYDIPSSEREKALTALQQPFPVLTFLSITFQAEKAPIFPASFLGGSAPALQAIFLDRVPFPGLPKLVLSAAHLVTLHIRKIPHSGYISPEAMVAALSVLTRLEGFQIGFESPQSRPGRRTRRLPPPTRTLLPALHVFRFQGVGEYLEDFVARIDAPLLEKLAVIFFHQLIFGSPRFTQFISRTPAFKGHNEARVEFSYLDVMVTLPQKLGGLLELGSTCNQSDWQLSFLAQVCTSPLTQALIPTVEHLYIRSGYRLPDWQDDIESGQWLELFQPFAATKELYISSEFTPRIAPALKEFIRDGVIEVLPALQTLFLEEPLPSRPVQEAIEEFVAARQLAGHPIAVSRWKKRR
jgi:hypothetical protein